MAITRSAASIKKMNEQWSKAVGRAILAFGNIEWVTYQCLGLFPSDRIFESVVSLKFSSRVDLIVEILSGKNLPKKLFNKTKRLFKRAKDAAEVRNVLAHNPLRIGVYKDNDGKVVFRDEIQHYRKTNRVYDLKEVQHYGKVTERLEDEFMELIGEIRKVLSSNKPLKPTP